MALSIKKPEVDELVAGSLLLHCDGAKQAKDEEEQTDQQVRTTRPEGELAEYVMSGLRRQRPLGRGHARNRMRRIAAALLKMRIARTTTTPMDICAPTPS